MSFKAKLISMGIESTMLDRIVEGAAEREADRVNAEGMAEQLSYLEKEGMSEEQILNELETDH